MIESPGSSQTYPAAELATVAMLSDGTSKFAAKSLFPGLLSRMIRPFGVRLDIRQIEPRRLELLVGVKLRLIEIVRRLRIGALPEHQNRFGLHLRPEVQHAHKGMAGYPEVLLIALLRRARRS